MMESLVIFVVNVMFFSVMFGFHSLADYPLQGEFLARYKSENFFVLLCHCSIYALVVTLGFYILQNITKWTTDSSYVFIYFILFITHVVIDMLKCFYRDELKKEYPDLDDSNSEGHKKDVKGFYYDQIAHLIVIWLLI